MAHSDFFLNLKAFGSWLLVGAALQSAVMILPASAQAANDVGDVAFVGQSQTYLGRYSVSGATLAVEIDGLVYRGTYSANADSPAPAAGNLPPGTWGNAYLFASSASVLQCQLSSAFPQASGHCLAADSRRFVLQPLRSR